MVDPIADINAQNLGCLQSQAMLASTKTWPPSDQLGAARIPSLAA
jgi:hypothetical protein